LDRVDLQDQHDGKQIAQPRNCAASRRGDIHGRFTPTAPCPGVATREGLEHPARARGSRTYDPLPPNPLAGGNSPDRDTICTLLSLRRWFFNMFGARDACLSVKRAYGGLINLLADTRDHVRIHFATDHIASARADLRSV